MPGPSATAALASALRPVGPGHRASRLVTSLLTGDDPPLVAAVVGPSGVGKSTLVNRLAGELVTTAGVLRPTTLDAVEWASPDGRLHLIDAPPSDQLPESGLAAIDGADLAIVVTSQLRYADAATWECLAQARTAAIPAVVAVTRVEPLVADLIADDVAHRAGDVAVVSVPEGDGGSGVEALRSLLDAAADDVAAIRAARRHGLAGEAAAEVRRLAGDVGLAEEGRAVLAEAVAEAAAACSIPIADVAPAASGRPEDLDALACAVLGARGGALTAALGDVWLSRGLACPEGDPTLTAGDAAAIEAWRLETAERFTAAISPRWLLRPAGSRVTDESWRLSIDRGRPRRVWVRLALRRRADALGADRAEALARLLAERVSTRLDAYAAAVPDPSPLDPDRLQALAGRLAAEHPAVAPGRAQEPDAAPR